MYSSSTKITIRHIVLLFFIGATFSLSGCKKGIISGSLSNEKANSFNFNAGTKTQTRVDSNGYLVLENDSSTNTTLSDFLSGSFDPTEATLPSFSSSGDGELTLGKVWRYSSETSPALPFGYPNGMSKTGNFLFVQVYGTGVTVIDTFGTEDISDDSIVGTYSDVTVPSLSSTYAWNFYYDEANDLLYVIDDGPGGTTVIDTNGTLDDMSDDTLVGRYTSATTPAVTGGAPSFNSQWAIQIDDVSGYIYLGTGSGLFVIDTHFTKTLADDTLVGRYYSGSTPALVNNSTPSFVFDQSKNQIIIANDSAYSVINTQGTGTLADDVIATTYPNFVPKFVFQTSSLNLLFVTGIANQDVLAAIDTKGTANIADDVVYDNFKPDLDPASTYGVRYDPTMGYLYVYGTEGVKVYNLNGTPNPSDDVLVRRYGFNTSPSIGTDFVMNLTIDGNLLYFSTDIGLVVLRSDDRYSDSASFISAPVDIGTTYSSFLSWDQVKTSDHDVSIQYRTGTSDAVYRNDFDDNLTTEFEIDPFSFSGGADFNTAVESGGTLKLSDPTPDSWSNNNSYAYFWIDTGMPAGHFTVGSIVTVRMRINSNTRTQEESYDDIFADDYPDPYDEGASGFIPNNEWTILRMNISGTDFSKIGFGISFGTGTWDPSDTVEVDWLQIETPDSVGEWSAWSTACTNNLSCEIDPADLVGQTWMQYRINMSTTDNTTTPVVSAVTWNDAYQASGTYESLNSSFNGPTFLKSFEADVDLVAGSTIDFEYSTNGGISWISMSSSQAFAEGTLITSFQWRATLATVDPVLSPRILNARVVTSK